MGAGSLREHRVAGARPARGRAAFEVRVELAERSYDVLVGTGVRHDLPAVVPSTARRAAVVTQAAIDFEVDPGVKRETFVIGEGEAAKTLGTVEDLCVRFARWGLTREDVVVAVGGGIVTDTAGLAASLYHRGVGVIHVPTTLLGQLDASIGGKTGVNLSVGKNLVGTFWQPLAVLCDMDALATLPRGEYASGLGEIARLHLLSGEDLDRLPLDARIAACVRMKASVVSADEQATSERAIFNYGHTLAHALEIAGCRLRHGEAVAVGLVFAARLARQLGRIDDARVRDHEEVVQRYGLPTTLPSAVDLEELVVLMRRDKKAIRGFTFVLDGPAGPEQVARVSEADVRTVLNEMRFAARHERVARGGM
jgi:5-deoxy-5-amino-3-dehydroquinate synthase